MIRSDGSLLPIEERLGKRLLRILDPGSRAGRALLLGGSVSLTRSDGRAITDLPLEAVYERLRSEAAARLLAHGGSPQWRRHFRAALASIERWKRALSRDH